MTVTAAETDAAADAEATLGMPAGGATVTVLTRLPVARLVVPLMLSVIVAPAGNVATDIPAPWSAAIVSGVGHVAPPVVLVQATEFAAKKGIAGSVMIAP